VNFARAVLGLNEDRILFNKEALLGFAGALREIDPHWETGFVNTQPADEVGELLPLGREPTAAWIAENVVQAHQLGFDRERCSGPTVTVVAFAQGFVKGP
jgi:hypothetical protein